jgi:oligopeptide transport system ATP-binding protein
MTMAAPETIEVEDLGVTFAGGVQAVAGVSLALRIGETLGLVGESGSGKTTLAKALVGLNRPSSGRVRLAGRDLTGLRRSDRLWLRRRVQMIFQDPLSSLSPRFTLRRLLAEPIAIHRFDRRTHWPKVLDLMARLGLAEGQLEKYPHQISGGQARRVAIARALVAEPSFLIADEPTAGLDVSIQGELLNLLADLQKSFSLGILIVSHNLNVIGRVTDRVAIMYLGKIVEEGPTRAVFRAPKHPYTYALLSANPVIDPEHKRTKLVLSGEIPSPSNPPPGCRFHTRCPRAQPVCRIDEPPLTPTEDGRRYACHFPLQSASYSASASPPSGRSS